jgi:hypothetical protein
MKARSEPPVSPLSLRLAAIASLGGVLSLWVWKAIYVHAPQTDGGDGPFFFRLLEASKVSLGRWHELPLWNPYECGGVPLWDNPQSIIAAPLVFLLQPFDTTFTMGAWAVVHVTIGFVGTWLLCRDELGTSRLAAFAAACLFAFSAPLSNHIAGGHTAFATFQFAPLALFFWRRAETDHRHALGLGLVVANLLFSGGVYTLANLGLMLLIETCTRLTSAKRSRDIVRAGAIVGLVAVTVGAARLFPLLDQVTHHRRPLGGEGDFLDWKLLKDMYLDRSHALHLGHDYVWGEYVAYCGPIVLLLAAIGLALSARERPWMVIVGGAVFVLMLGHFAKWAPWHLLKGNVPPFTGMRVPARFRMLLVMFIAAWVAIAIDRLPLWLSRLKAARGRARPVRRLATVVVTGAAFIGAGDVASTSADNIIVPQWNGPVPAKVEPAPRLHLLNPPSAQFIDQPRQNVGRLECWEEWIPFVPQAIWVGDVPQARALTVAATVRSVERTQNSFRVALTATEPTTVLFNTSFARGWRSNAGTPRELNGQLAVELPAGEYPVLEVWYWPVGLTAGLLTTALGLLGVGFALTRRRPGPLTAPSTP